MSYRVDFLVSLPGSDPIALERRFQDLRADLTDRYQRLDLSVLSYFEPDAQLAGYVRRIAQVLHDRPVEMHVLILVLVTSPPEDDLLQALKAFVETHATSVVFVRHAGLDRAIIHRLERMLYHGAGDCRPIDPSVEAVVEALRALVVERMDGVVATQELDAVQPPDTDQPDASGTDLIATIPAPPAARTLPPPSILVPPPVSYSVPPGLNLKPVTFRYIPPPGPDEDPYHYPENSRYVLQGAAPGPSNAWVIAGASRRGLSHWSKGSPREDAFHVGAQGQWNVIALSDGAGASAFSRQTANQSVRLAVKEVLRHALPVPADRGDARARIESAMQTAIRQVHRYQTEFTESQGFTRRDTYCTFLLLVHQPFEDGSSVFGTLQVGDGCLLASSGGQARRLEMGDHGADAATSFFVLSFTEEELAGRPRTYYSRQPVEMFMLMSDGIEDDLKPSNEEYADGVTLDNKLGTFAQLLRERYLIWPCWRDWGEILDRVISYERRGSYDDRTLVLLTQRPDDTACRQ